MRQRPFIIVAAALAALFVLAGAVYAYDSSRDGTIAKGITVGGVDVGGMTRAAAEARLHDALLGPLNQPVVVHHDTQTWELRPSEARIAADVSAMVDEALARSHEGGLVGRTLRELVGGSVNDDIAPQVSYSDAAIIRLLDRVRAAVDRKPVDAKLDISGKGLGRVPGRDGLAVDASALHRRIRAAIVSPSAGRTFVAHTHHVLPLVTTDQLAERNPAVIVVNRGAFTLRFYKHLHLAKTYRIAVGRVGLETPAGLYHVQNKAINPAWHVPKRPWAGKLAGKVIPGGTPENPIKARWLGIYDGAGIHGTEDDSSIGSAASHGCIRMHIPDVIALYPQVPVGAPVYIA